MDFFWGEGVLNPAMKKAITTTAQANSDVTDAGWFKKKHF